MMAFQLKFQPIFPRPKPVCWRNRDVVRLNPKARPPFARCAKCSRTSDSLRLQVSAKQAESLKPRQREPTSCCRIHLPPNRCSPSLNSYHHDWWLTCGALVRFSSPANRPCSFNSSLLILPGEILRRNFRARLAAILRYCSSAGELRPCDRGSFLRLADLPPHVPVLVRECDCRRL